MIRETVTTGPHPNHISKSAIAALTLPLAPSAIWRVMVMGAPQCRERKVARFVSRVQGSRLSRVHLVVLPDGRQHGLEVVEVEAGCDLDVGDHPLADPGVDAAGADRQALGKFLLLDEGGFDGAAVDEVPF